MGVVDLDIHVSSHLKKELAWAVDEQLWVISIRMLFKNNKNTKELQVLRSYKELQNKAILNLERCCLRCYVALSNIF